MNMTFEAFEIAPARTLSAAQEKALARKYLCGDMSGGKWATVESLIRLGMIAEDGKGLVMTEKGSHYCFHHGKDMSV